MIDALDKHMSSYDVLSQEMVVFADSVRHYLKTRIVTNFSEIGNVMYSLYLVTVHSN
jgi:hypothetical protein